MMEYNNKKTKNMIDYFQKKLTLKTRTLIDIYKKHYIFASAWRLR